MAGRTRHTGPWGCPDRPTPQGLRGRTDRVALVLLEVRDQEPQVPTLRLREERPEQLDVDPGVEPQLLVSVRGDPGVVMLVVPVSRDRGCGRGSVCRSRFSVVSGLPFAVVARFRVLGGSWVGVSF